MDVFDLLGKVEKTEEDDKISYSTGIVMAMSLKDMGFDEMDYKDFIEGMTTVFEHQVPKISPRKAIDIFNNYVALLQEELKVKNTEIGLAFLEENAQKTSVKTLESGLQYEIMEKGSGAIPSLNDTVSVIYEGYLLNKNVFDSTKESGPQNLKVSEMIQGWKEVLQIMPVGSRWRVTIPHYLAYGEIGAPPMIQPNATLVFIIELQHILS